MVAIALIVIVRGRRERKRKPTYCRHSFHDLM